MYYIIYIYIHTIHKVVPPNDRQVDAHNLVKLVWGDNELVHGLFDPTYNW